MRSSRSSLISSVLLKSTRESTNDPFCSPLSQMRKETGDSVTCLPLGEKGSWGLSWGCSSGLEEQVGGADLWGLLSSWLQTRGHNKDKKSASQEGACSEH